MRQVRGILRLYLCQGLGYFRMPQTGRVLAVYLVLLSVVGLIIGAVTNNALARDAGGRGAYLASIFATWWLIHLAAALMLNGMALFESSQLKEMVHQSMLPISRPGRLLMKFMDVTFFFAFLYPVLTGPALVVFILAAPDAGGLLRHGLVIGLLLSGLLIAQLAAMSFQSVVGGLVRFGVLARARLGFMVMLWTGIGFAGLIAARPAMGDVNLLLQAILEVVFLGSAVHLLGVALVIAGAVWLMLRLSLCLVGHCYLDNIVRLRESGLDRRHPRGSRRVLRLPLIPLAVQAICIKDIRINTRQVAFWFLLVLDLLLAAAEASVVFGLDPGLALDAVLGTSAGGSALFQEVSATFSLLAKDPSFPGLGNAKIAFIVMLLLFLHAGLWQFHFEREGACQLQFYPLRPVMLLAGKTLALTLLAAPFALCFVVCDFSWFMAGPPGARLLSLALQLVATCAVVIVISAAFTNYHARTLSDAVTVPGLLSYYLAMTVLQALFLCQGLLAAVWPGVYWLGSACYLVIAFVALSWGSRRLPILRPAPAADAQLDAAAAAAEPSAPRLGQQLWRAAAAGCLWTLPAAAALLYIFSGLCRFQDLPWRWQAGLVIGLALAAAAVAMPRWPTARRARLLLLLTIGGSYLFALRSSQISLALPASWHLAIADHPVQADLRWPPATESKPPAAWAAAVPSPPLAAAFSLPAGTWQEIWRTPPPADVVAFLQTLSAAADRDRVGSAAGLDEMIEWLLPGMDDEAWDRLTAALPADAATGPLVSLLQAAFPCASLSMQLHILLQLSEGPAKLQLNLARLLQTVDWSRLTTADEALLLDTVMTHWPPRDGSSFSGRAVEQSFSSVFTDFGWDTRLLPLAIISRLSTPDAFDRLQTELLAMMPPRRRRRFPPVTELLHGNDRLLPATCRRLAADYPRYLAFLAAAHPAWRQPADFRRQLVGLANGQGPLRPLLIAVSARREFELVGELPGAVRQLVLEYYRAESVGQWSGERVTTVWRRNQLQRHWREAGYSAETIADLQRLLNGEERRPETDLAQIVAAMGAEDTALLATLLADDLLTAHGRSNVTAAVFAIWTRDGDTRSTALRLASLLSAAPAPLAELPIQWWALLGKLAPADRGPLLTALVKLDVNALSCISVEQYNADAAAFRRQISQLLAQDHALSLDTYGAFRAYHRLLGIDGDLARAWLDRVSATDDEARVLADVLDAKPLARPALYAELQAPGGNFRPFLWQALVMSHLADGELAQAHVVAAGSGLPLLRAYAHPGGTRVVKRLRRQQPLFFAAVFALLIAAGSLYRQRAVGRQPATRPVALAMPADGCPQFRQAVVLLLIVLLVQQPLAVYFYVAGLDLTDPLVIGAVNLLSFGGIMIWAASRPGLSWRRLLPLTSFTPLLLLPLLAVAVGLGIVASETDNVLRAYLPLPQMLEDLYLSVISRGWRSLVLIVILAPVIEEIVFRGLLLRSFLVHYRPWLAITASAALFAVFHLNPYQLLPAFLWGLVLGWLFWRTRSLWPCIAAHALNNAQVILVQLADLITIPGFNTATSAPHQPWWLSCLGLLLLVGGACWLRSLAPRAPATAD